MSAHSVVLPSVPPVAAVLAPAKESFASNLKEYVAALLSLAIIAVTVCFLFRVFSSTGTPEDQKRQSAVLHAALALAGTVTGYYFGRVPAERAAANAQQSASNTQQALVTTASVAQQATAAEQRIRAQVGDLRRTLTSPIGGGAEGADVTAYRAQIIKHVERILD
jgi:4-amino-4-deoxy-L-arabinose transferase-like glycosyltransferase